MSTVAITGNTYPVKEQIKALGGRWNADQKAWMIPADKADAARKLVAGASKSSNGSRFGSYATIGARQESRMARTGWRGCSCGSIEGQPRRSDCWSCKHDSE